MKTMKADVVVIGGGVIGAAVAYGLVEQKAAVVMLDREDFQLTASRGNFGLVWLQGKGYGMPRYAQWSQEATELWSNFAEKLEDQTGIPQYYHELVDSKFVWERKNTASEVHSSKRCEPSP